MIISQKELNKLLAEEFSRAYIKAKNDYHFIQDVHTKSTKSEIDNKIKEVRFVGYKDGYKAGQKNGQKNGAHNTWALVLKLIDLYDKYYYPDWKNIFGEQSLIDVFENYSAEEISKKINEYKTCKKCCFYPSNGISCNSICIQCEDGSKFKMKIDKECLTCGWLNYITSDCKCPDKCDDTKKCWKPDLDCFGEYLSEKCQKCNYEDMCIDNSNKKEPIVNPDHYEKTINFGALPNATTKSVEHNITGIDKIWKVTGVSYNDNGESIVLPYFDSDGIYSILLSADKNSITISTGVNRTKYTKTYVTIEYTKTTDE